MPLLPNEFDSHDVWVAESEVSALLSKVSGTSTGGDTDLVEVIHWIRLTLADVKALKLVEPWRFPSATTVLDELNDGLDSLKTALIEVDSDDVEHTKTTLLMALDEVTTAIMKSPLQLVPKERAIEAKQAIDEHRILLHETLNELRTSLADVSGKAEEIEGEIETQKTHFASQVKRIDTLVDDQGRVFGEKTSEWEKKSDEAAASIVKRGETYVAELQGIEKEARDLVSSTARWSISTNYGLYARNQSIAAWVWSILSMLTLGAGFFWVSDVVQKFKGDGTAPVLLTEGILKFTVTSILVVAAGFMMKSAAGHRAESRDAKRTQLDLNTLEPFIREMSPEDRAAMRMKFARKIFGRPMANSKTDTHYLWGDTEETLPSEKDDADALDKVK